MCILLNKKLYLLTAKFFWNFCAINMHVLRKIEYLPYHPQMTVNWYRQRSAGNLKPEDISGSIERLIIILHKIIDCI